jgi:large subunit ribosomal protein L21
MFAVIKSGGRQYKVSVGQKLEVNRLAVEDGTQIQIGEVLLISGADQQLIGAPYIDNAAVLATVERQARGEKLIVFKYKSKKRYRHRRGHRQELTILNIDDIVTDGKSLVTGQAASVRELPIVPVAVEEESPTEGIGSVPVAPSEAVVTDEKRPRRRRTLGSRGTESSTEE